MTRVVRNPNFELEVQVDPEFIARMGEVTRTVAEEARRIAPKKTHYYERRVEPYIRATATTIRNARIPAGYHVLSGDPFGHLVEGGSVNNPPYAPLRRGARAAGLRLAPTPKS